MSMQTNGGALWPESAGSGVALATTPYVAIADGADWLLTTPGLEGAAFFDHDASGDYELLALSAVAAGTPRLHAVHAGADVQLY